MAAHVKHAHGLAPFPVSTPTFSSHVASFFHYRQKQLGVKTGNKASLCAQLDSSEYTHWAEYSTCRSVLPGEGEGEGEGRGKRRGGIGRGRV